MNRKELRIIYAGMVQGVGFRWTVKRLSCGYEVVGVVRNLSNGGVELVAQGQQSELEDFAQAIRESGLGPLIRDEAISWSQLPIISGQTAVGYGKCYKSFEIA